jgi:hypothetical protein
MAEVGRGWEWLLEPALLPAWMEIKCLPPTAFQVVLLLGGRGTIWLVWLPEGAAS